MVQNERTSDEGKNIAAESRQLNPWLQARLQRRISLSAQPAMESRLSRSLANRRSSDISEGKGWLSRQVLNRWNATASRPGSGISSLPPFDPVGLKPYLVSTIWRKVDFEWSSSFHNTSTAMPPMFENWPRSSEIEPQVINNQPAVGFEDSLVPEPKVNSPKSSLNQTSVTRTAENARSVSRKNEMAGNSLPISGGSNIRKEPGLNNGLSEKDISYQSVPHSSTIQPARPIVEEKTELRNQQSQDVTERPSKDIQFRSDINKSQTVNREVLSKPELNSVLFTPQITSSKIGQKNIINPKVFPVPVIEKVEKPIIKLPLNRMKVSRSSLSSVQRKFEGGTADNDIHQIRQKHSEKSSDRPLILRRKPSQSKTSASGKSTILPDIARTATVSDSKSPDTKKETISGQFINPKSDLSISLKEPSGKSVLPEAKIDLKDIKIKSSLDQSQEKASSKPVYKSGVSTQRTITPAKFESRMVRPIELPVYNRIKPKASLTAPMLIKKPLAISNAQAQKNITPYSITAVNRSTGAFRSGGKVVSKDKSPGLSRITGNDNAIKGKVTPASDVVGSSGRIISLKASKKNRDGHLLTPYQESGEPNLSGDRPPTLRRVTGNGNVIKSKVFLTPDVVGSSDRVKSLKASEKRQDEHLLTPSQESDESVTYSSGTNQPPQSEILNAESAESRHLTSSTGSEPRSSVINRSSPQSYPATDSEMSSLSLPLIKKMRSIVPPVQRSFKSSIPLSVPKLAMDSGFSANNIADNHRIIVSPKSQLDLPLPVPGNIKISTRSQLGPEINRFTVGSASQHLNTGNSSASPRIGQHRASIPDQHSNTVPSQHLNSGDSSASPRTEQPMPSIPNPSTNTVSSEPASMPGILPQNSTNTGEKPDLKALARELYPFLKRMIIVDKERMPT